MGVRKDLNEGKNGNEDRHPGEIDDRTWGRGKHFRAREPDGGTTSDIKN